MLSWAVEPHSSFRSAYQECTGHLQICNGQATFYERRESNPRPRACQMQKQIDAVSETKLESWSGGTGQGIFVNLRVSLSVL